jgi:hypothetical protein
MDTSTHGTKAFLSQLHSMVKGDLKAQASMYEVGESLGLEKTEAGSLAEALFIEGYAELKTLSGGIGITRQGLEALDMKIDYRGDEAMQLGSGPVMEDPGKASLEKILGEIRAFLGGVKTPYGQLEALVMDIKTIEVQMLSPHPKTAIIREILKSIAPSLAGDADLKGKLDALIGS